MTQEDLAFASGAGRAAIARMETGRQLPSLPTLVRLAEALGVEASEVVRLIEREGTAAQTA
jgi:transcriptional regulator with XRE-family HTH domain